MHSCLAAVSRRQQSSHGSWAELFCVSMWIFGWARLRIHIHTSVLGVILHGFIKWMASPIDPRASCLLNTLKSFWRQQGFINVKTRRKQKSLLCFVSIYLEIWKEVRSCKLTSCTLEQGSQLFPPSAAMSDVTAARAAKTLLDLKGSETKSALLENTCLLMENRFLRTQVRTANVSQSELFQQARSCADAFDAAVTSCLQLTALLFPLRPGHVWCFGTSPVIKCAACP